MRLFDFFKFLFIFTVSIQKQTFFSRCWYLFSHYDFETLYVSTYVGSVDVGKESGLKTAVQKAFSGDGSRDVLSTCSSTDTITPCLQQSLNS